MKVRTIVALRASAVVLTCSLTVTPTFAQESGRVSGVIVDPNNAVVVRGRVTVGNEKRKYIAYSDDNGRFQFDIPGGSYNLSVESAGFLRYVNEEIKVTQGSKDDLTVSLTIDPTPVCILTVESGAPWLEPPTSHLIEKIDAPASERIKPRKIP